MVYWFTTEVEPMCSDSYLLRHLLRKIGGWGSTYSGSGDLWWWGLTMPAAAVRTRWWGDVLQRVTSKTRTRVYLVKGYFQYEGKGCEALARTQVYLSKTKLRKYKWVSSYIYTYANRGQGGAGVRGWSKWQVIVWEIRVRVRQMWEKEVGVGKTSGGPCES